MQLRLAFRQCVNMSSYEIWFTLCILQFFAYLTPRNIWAALPKESSICQPLKVLWKQGIKFEVLLGFKNFQIVAHEFLGC